MIRLLLALAVVLAIVPASARASDSVATKRLRAKVERLETSRNAWVAKYRTTAARLVDAQAGLPAAINAVDASSFRAMVIDPAALRWRALGFCSGTTDHTVVNDGVTHASWTITFESWPLGDAFGC